MRVLKSTKDDSRTWYLTLWLDCLLLCILIILRITIENKTLSETLIMVNAFYRMKVIAHHWSRFIYIYIYEVVLNIKFVKSCWSALFIAKWCVHYIFKNTIYLIQWLSLSNLEIEFKKLSQENISMFSISSKCSRRFTVNQCFLCPVLCQTKC